MEASHARFKIATADRLEIVDSEISALLTEVYVAGGFTSPGAAALQFQPAAVRKRGILIGARECRHSRLVGIVILVPPDSPARQLAKDREAELHLLGVIPAYRRNGLGRMLVEAAVAQANQSGYTKIILWTQHSMHAAQRLYESTGFLNVRNGKIKGHDFYVYERILGA